MSITLTKEKNKNSKVKKGRLHHDAGPGNFDLFILNFDLFNCNNV